MEESHGLGRYLNLVLDAVSLELRPIVDGSGTNIGERVIAHVLGEPEPPSAQAPRTARQAFVAKVFSGINEIHASIEALDNIEKYIRRYPYTKVGVSKSSYLRYHVENHLQEVHILRERVNRYLTVVQRSYRREADADNIRTEIERMRESVSRSFEGICRTRGIHVHAKRYDDDDLSRLSSLELLAPNMPVLLPLLEQAVQRVRADKVAWIRENNSAVRTVLDPHFDTLATIVFRSDLTLRFPRNIRAR